MDDLIEKLNELKVSIDIIDGYSKTSVSEIERLWSLVHQIKSVLGEYKGALDRIRLDTEKFKVQIEHLQVLNDRMDYIGVNLPRNVLKESQPVVNEPAQELGINGTNHISDISPIPLQSSSKINFSVFDSNSMENILFSNEPLISKNGPTTPKPRANLGVSISYISNNELHQVPSYMKGRLKLDECNAFIDVYNNVLTLKYDLFNKPKAAIKTKKDLEQWNVWKKEAKHPELTGQYFCTAKDIAGLGKLKLGKKEFTFITILRHLKRLKEIRTSQKETYYLACF